MDPSEREVLKEQLSLLAAGRGDGIDLDSPERWAVEGLRDPAAFFRYLAELIPRDSILYFEASEYDMLNRLLSVCSAPSAASALSFSYLYNDANQRIQCRLADGSFWVCQYDALGQVKSGKKYWPDWTALERGAWKREA